MKEAVRQVKHGWMVVVAMIAMGGAYFFLLGSSDFEEPGANILYDIQAFKDLDLGETPYAELPPIVSPVPNIRALTTGPGKTYVACENAVVVYGNQDQEIARYAVDGNPSCIAAGPDGTLYVGMQSKVAILAPDGSLKATWSDFSTRSFITAIAIKETNVFVADAGNRVVYRYDQNGTLQNKIGEKNPAQDVPGLEVPSPYLDIAVNADGELWVVNPGKLGLERYRDDGSIVTSWYKPTVLALDGFPGCCNPTHIAFSSKGELFTSEKGLVRVKKFEVTAGGFDGLVVGSKLFPREQSLRDLAVDSRDRIMVLDGQRNSVRVFARKEASNGPTAS